MDKLQRAKRSLKKEPDNFRKQFIKVRVSAEEKKIFQEVAIQRGLTVAELIRSVIQEYEG